MNSPVYDPQAIELRWQQHWLQTGAASAGGDGEPFYLLEMFPYPSGRIHMGHVRNYTIGDVLGRFHRACGYRVLHPMGWDAFGLPAEQAAIKNGVAPARWTRENIETMRDQLVRMGFEVIGTGQNSSLEMNHCLFRSSLGRQGRAKPVVSVR